MQASDTEERLKRLAREVGYRLKKLRDDHKLKRSELAAKIQQGGGEDARKINEETVRRWEKGLTLCPIDKIYQLAEIYNEPPEYLMFALRRHEEMKRRGDRLFRLSATETEIVRVFRQISEPAQSRALQILQDMAKAHPAILPPITKLITKKRTGSDLP